MDRTMRNTCLDDFKKDIKNINTQLDYLHKKIMNIVDNEGFSKDTMYSVGKKLKELNRDVVRVRRNADTLEEYIIHGARFTKIKYILDELNSNLQTLKLACLADKEMVYNCYLDDVVSILARLSDNLITYTMVSNSEDIIKEELDLLKIEQNKLYLVKE